MLEPTSSSAIEGIRSGLRELDRAAAQVAQAGTTRPDLPPLDGLLDARQAQLQVEASAKMLGTANRTLGSLLDVFA